MFNWNDTLIDYLKRSNEDEQVVRFVNASVLPVLVQMDCAIRWLDVGPGPGRKTSAVANALARVKTAGTWSIRLLEPDPWWCEFLRQNSPVLLNAAQLMEMKFEDYARDELERRDSWRPNLITCFHVLYEHDLIEEFLLYLEHQGQLGSRLLACAVVESERSTFFQLRQQLKRLGQPQPIPAVVELRNAIRRRGLPAQESAIDGQYYHVSADEDAIERLMAFLFGCGISSLEELPKGVRAEAREIIHRFLAEKRDQALEVPDVAFTFSIG